MWYFNIVILQRNEVIVMETSTPLLLPCPFCGHKNPKITTKRLGDSTRTGEYKQVLCSKCKARGPIFASQYEGWSREVVRTPEEAESLAIEAWNRRTN